MVEKPSIMKFSTSKKLQAKLELFEFRSFPRQPPSKLTDIFSQNFVFMIPNNVFLDLGLRQSFHFTKRFHQATRPICLFLCRKTRWSYFPINLKACLC